ncbi:MAG: ATP phosphoribosyltransferase [Alphaproteobacteria bacterium]|nr:ATP phosphoribosyltransferase [Alphaproteobacteria bacterium]MDA8004510.1 ATP phosphoribosyltransferase [Alphaproteobacteria bacterium]MDA8006374.1 ATP phosphoribosyltransferase [Alphaproteobacteria bacterium]MDA8013750.1 ATP phosphoribosyltransferase [Alphaproteobacteria bacterium]
MTTMKSDSLVFAVPRGRILRDATPLLKSLGLLPAPGLLDESDRRLQFASAADGVNFVRVRSFDAATFVAFGGAHFGLAGTDVLSEFRYPEVYAPVDLGLSRCRMVVAEDAALAARDSPMSWSQVRVATKYPRLTRRHFAARGVQAETIELSGAVELAPSLGLARRIVDLVDTGRTLAANNLVEVEHVLDVSLCLVVNRTAFKLRHGELLPWIDRFRAAAAETATATASATTPATASKKAPDK